MSVQNIFAAPVGTESPPANIAKRKDHPAPRLGITGSPPLSTNKFYANFFLGSQASSTYLHPFSVAWAKGKGATASWGLAISHIDPAQRVFGPPKPGTGAASYFLNPVGIQSVVISAKELGTETALTTDLLTHMSVRVNLRPHAATAPVIQFHLMQGSAFITGEFGGATPMFQTGVFFKTVTRSSKAPKAGISKYKLFLEDGTTWLLYAYHAKGNPLDLKVVNKEVAQASGPFYGIVQITKDPGNGETVYDEACGAFAAGGTLSGSVNGKEGTYKIAFSKAGMPSGKLAMYALPHHVASFDEATLRNMTKVKLQTTTKGVATLVVGDCWTMVEKELPTDISFVPWSSKAGSVSALSNETKQFIHKIAQQEVSQDMSQQSNLDSMYFSGKALAKFALIVLTISEMLGDKSLAASGLKQLQAAFARFSENRQQHPLVYESAWGGVVSSASYATGNSGADFGNTYYNDHHFHYGYFILAAAIIGHLDPAWIPPNKDYVNTLVRDVANPSSQDPYFPLWRSFDWYHGHSWAHGLFESSDGKDQESSSEDTMHTYAIKMWATATGDDSMLARANLMLAIQARSLPSYYLYTTSNTLEPAKFIGNKVAGILFENKIDHTTYFGDKIEYVQGIHMIPLLPHTQYIRSPTFVSQEWNTYFSNGRADHISGGWKSILYGNYATVDPKGAYTFFSTPNFDPGWLDGGASLTWYLAYAAVLGAL